MSNANVKFNRAGGSRGGFVQVPYNFMRLTASKNGKLRKLSETELTVCAAVFSLQKRDEEGNLVRECDFTYDELVKRYNLSRSAVARTVKILSDNNLIAKGEQTSRYHCDVAKEDDGFLFIEDWLRAAVFTLNGEEYRLTKKEIRVLSYLISITNEGNKTVYGSASWIAHRLNISPTTAGTALKRLKDLKLLHISGNAINGHKSVRARYNLDGDVIRQKRRAYASERRKKKIEQNDLDEKARRERFYAERKQEAIDHAERMKRQAQRDERFKLADDSMRALDVKIAKAEAFSLPELDQLRQQYAQAQRLRSERMQALNLSEEDFTPQWACTKCSDTGFTPSGKPCACFSPRRRS